MEGGQKEDREEAVEEGRAGRRGNTADGLAWSSGCGYDGITRMRRIKATRLWNFELVRRQVKRDGLCDCDYGIQWWREGGGDSDATIMPPLLRQE